MAAPSSEYVNSGCAFSKAAIADSTSAWPYSSSNMSGPPATRAGTRIDPVKSSWRNPASPAGAAGGSRRQGHRRRRRRGHRRDRHRGGDRDLGRRPREQGLDLAQELLRVEGLRDDGIAAEPLGSIAIEGLERPGQEHHRHAGRGGVRLDRLADLVAVFFRHHDIREDQVGNVAAGDAVEHTLAVGDADQVVFAVRKGQLDDLLNREAVISQKDLSRQVLAL